MTLTKVSYSMIDGAAANVLDYGAAGDGVTDDTSAIQAALNSTAKAIVFPQGKTFFVTAELTSTVAGRTIWGYGATITTDATIAAADNVLVVSGSNSTVAGLTITGDAGVTLCSGLRIETGSFITAVENHISDFENGAGISTDNAGTGHVISNNFLDNCSPVSFGGNQYGSIHIRADNSVVSGNRITNNALTGISLFGASYVSITDNYIEGKAALATVGGIIFDGLTIGCVIDGNIINTGDVEGIQIAGSITTYGAASRDHTVSNNTVVNSDYSAITLFAAQADSVTNINVCGNNLKTDGTTGRGIELNRVSKINITGNYIYGYDVGLNVVNSSPDVNLSGNFFENQTTTGVQVYGSKWNVSGNKIVGNGTTTVGVRFNASSFGGEQMITGNQISNCDTGLIGTFSGSFRTYVYCNHFLDNTTDYSLTSQTTNSVNYNTFDEVLSGTVTLVAGAATVNSTVLAAEDKIVLTKKTAGGTAGAVYVNTRTNGAGFTIASTSGLDTSTIAWELVR